MLLVSAISHKVMLVLIVLQSSFHLHLTEIIYSLNIFPAPIRASYDTIFVNVSFERSGIKL